MIQLLLDLLEAPDPCTLETFLGRVHMVFNVVILSPHCYFAQDNVLGYPDTGGQVVYILDQVRDHNKPIIFTMARLDRVKNITGLVMWYGKNARLCELVNLVVVVGDKRKESKDLEEKAEMNNMYGLIETYKLKDQFRWISSQMYARNNYGFNTISWI
ncbi:Sucrose synthase [Glycine soja]|uniref:sucrose synthase n=1 Tax=Glycine soja TaxID=3848 RepID=A0A0B2RL56_GLYSO|nr:Sucrose synthase [Glycine soja]